MIGLPVLGRSAIALRPDYTGSWDAARSRCVHACAAFRLAESARRAHLVREIEQQGGSASAARRRPALRRAGSRSLAVSSRSGAGMAAAIVVSVPLLPGDPESPVFLDSTEQLVAATPFLGWQPAAAAGAGPPRVFLLMFQMVRAFLARCTLSKAPGHPALLRQANPLNLRITGAAWGRILSEYVASGLLAALPGAACVKDLASALRDLAISNPAQLELTRNLFFIFRVTPAHAWLVRHRVDVEQGHAGRPAPRLLRGRRTSGHPRPRRLSWRFRVVPRQAGQAEVRKALEPLPGILALRDSRTIRTAQQLSHRC